MVNNQLSTYDLRDPIVILALLTKIIILTALVYWVHS
jgi:hypothetical protein